MTVTEVTQADYAAAQAFFRDERTGLAVKFQLGAEPQVLLEHLARHRTQSAAQNVPVLLEASRFYIDCEFDGHNGPLLSMAIVRDDDYSIHVRIAQEAKDPWVRKNVMPLMDQHKATQSGIAYINDLGGVIRAFLGDCQRPIIIADSPVDISRFCQALSTGSDGGWASADYPYMQFEVHNVDCYPTTLAGAVQHNAWWDAMALRAAIA